MKNKRKKRETKIIIKLSKKQFLNLVEGMWEFSIVQNTYGKKLNKEYRNLSSFLWKEYNKLERKNEI